MNPSTLTDTHQPQQQEHEAAAAYDPSQVQAYDQSYYTYTHHYDPQQHSTSQQQYPYYPPDYTNIYHQQPQHHHEPTSIHPPGVPIQPETSTHLAAPDYGQTHLQNQQNGYYPHGIVEQHQWIGNGGGFGPMPVHNSPSGKYLYRGGGRRGSKPFRGSGRGKGFHGRGHGQSRGQYGSSEGTAAYVQGQGPHALMLPHSQVHAAPFLAWCELCRVDCNTLEILEQHKNGKKHKRNLQVHEELQNLNKVISGMQNYQMPVSELKPVVVQPERVEGSVEKQAPLENLPLQISVAGPTNEAERKRNMRGGRGGKRMKISDGPRRPAKPPKPKQVIPLICELCNVNCESQVVLDSHLAGKKHLSNLKRFHGYQAVVGAAVFQALCQANPDVSSASCIPQVHQQGVHSPHDFLSHPQPYTLPQVPVPATTSAFAPELAPAAASTPTPIPIMDNDDQQDYSLNGSQDMTEAGNGSSATVEADKSQQQSSIVNGAMETETGIPEVEKEATTLLKNISDMAPSEPTVKETEQVPSATAIGKAATTP